ncbi:MAG: glycosyltransferase 87 family protein [Micrococcus sp.]|nr:glycosyltransferase 87 family protein [Micrococcus sp.]
MRHTRPRPRRALGPSEVRGHFAGGAAVPDAGPAGSSVRPRPRAGRHQQPLPDRLGRHGVAGGLTANAGRWRQGLWASPMTVTALLLSLAATATLLQKAPCLVNGWGAPNVYYAGCYSDWSALYVARGFADEPWAPFLPGSTFEYPVLMSFVASLAAQITHWLPETANGTLVFWLVNFAFVLGLWTLTAVLTVRMAGRRWWDGLMVAIAPGIILAGTINWDLWAVALLALGMYALARGRPAVAGVMIGLGAAMKIYPLLILGPLLILAVRRRDPRTLLWTAGGAAAGWLAVNLPLMIGNLEAWLVFFTFSNERGPGLSSMWHAWDVVAQRAGWPTVEVEWLSLMAYSLFALWCLAVFVLGITVRHTPRLAQLTFLVVAGFVLVNKVYSPQFVIWLIPLLALALPRWRDFWVWMVIEVLHFFAVWMYLAKGVSGSQPQHSMDDSVYVAAILAHMLAVLWLCGRVAVEMIRPELQVPGVTQS